MLAKLAVAVGIAAVDSLNPATIGQASVLAAGDRPRRSILAFWAGAFAFYLLLAAALSLGPARLIDGVLRDPPPALRIAQIALGVVAIAGGVVLWRRRRSVQLGRRLLGGSPRSAFRLGILVTVADLPNAFPFYGLVAYLAGSGLSHPRQLAVLVVYTFVYLLPVLIVLAVRALSGARAEPLLERVRDLVERYTATVASVVLAIAGAVLVAHGLVTLIEPA